MAEWPVLTKDIKATLREILESDQYADVDDMIEAIWQAVFKWLAGKDSHIIGWVLGGLRAYYGPFWTLTEANVIARKIGGVPGQLGLGSIRAPSSVKAPEGPSMPKGGSS